MSQLDQLPGSLGGTGRDSVCQARSCQTMCTKSRCGYGCLRLSGTNHKSQNYLDCLRNVLPAPDAANNLEGNSFSDRIKPCSSSVGALLVTRIILLCGQWELLFLVPCLRSSSLGCSDD